MEIINSATSIRVPWNNGKLVGHVPQPANQLGQTEPLQLATWLPPTSGEEIALYRQERIVIMDACKLSSTRWVASRACADLPTPGTVG
jgi:hypothetical protein